MAAEQVRVKSARATFVPSVKCIERNNSTPQVQRQFKMGTNVPQNKTHILRQMSCGQSVKRSKVQPLNVAKHLFVGSRFFFSQSRISRQQQKRRKHPGGGIRTQNHRHPISTPLKHDRNRPIRASKNRILASISIIIKTTQTIHYKTLIPIRI